MNNNSKSEDTLLKKALTLHQQGQLSQAKTLYEKILQNQPRQFVALHYLSVIAYQAGNYLTTVELINKAVELNQNIPDIYFNRGNALQKLKQFNDALASYEQAIALKSNYAEAYNNRGLVLQELKQFEAALASFDQAIALKPDYAVAYNNRGNVLKELKQFDTALASFDQAIALKSDYAVAYNNRGNIFQELKLFESALADYNKAITFKSNFNAETFYNRGNSLKELRQFNEALATYDQAIAIRSDYADAYNNRGIVLKELKQFNEALANYSQAIKLKPEYAEAYYNRGNALQKLKQFDAALANYDKALALRPDYKFLPSIRMHIKMQACDWSYFSHEVNQLTTLIEQYKKSSQPFEMLSLLDSLSLHGKTAGIYVKDMYPMSRALSKTPKYPKHQKIRIGYFSADFKEHPLAFLTAELYELHRRDRFEIIAFSFTPSNNSSIRKRLEAGFDHFIDASTMADKEIALLSCRMEIDIAVDLGGFTKDARAGIFAMRAAPIQVNYLGYPGTMGANFIDYIIADKVLIPPKSEQHYSEKVVYLPDTYWVNDSQLPISDKVFSRHELGLPEQGFVFCCFNNNYKITPNTFDGWMRILKRVKGSVLWLFEDNPYAASNLKKEAEIRGVSKDRLIFAQRMKSSEHLARHRVADLFLDTLPYNAHTTASDALWAGLPVLTCIGESFASRVAASLLTAIDLTELITTSQAGYEELAVKLATHPDLLKTLKQKLQANRLTTPLFNTQLFTQHIESAYTQMYERYQADLPPEPIYVENSHCCLNLIP